MKMSSRIAAGALAAGILAAPIGVTAMSATATAAPTTASSSVTGVRDYNISANSVTFYPAEKGSTVNQVLAPVDYGTGLQGAQPYPMVVNAQRHYNTQVAGFTPEAREVRNLKNTWMRNQVIYGNSHPFTEYAHAYYLKKASDAQRSNNSWTRVQVLNGINKDLDTDVANILGGVAAGRVTDVVPASISNSIAAAQRAFDASEAPVRARNGFGWIPFLGQSYVVNANNAITASVDAANRAVSPFFFIA